MKSIILFVILILSFPDLVAQTNHNTYFGLKGGLNRSNIEGKDLDNSFTGFTGTELYGSFFADTELSRNWRLENELLFSWTDEYHFIEIPIHIKRRILENWFFFLGPKFDFLLENSNDGGYFEAGYKFNNFSVSADAGIQYYFGSRFLAEARYSRGFIAQVDDLILDIYEGKRHTLRLGLGVMF